MKIAFILGRFPVLSETFVIHQIKGLMESGHEVDIYSALRGRDVKVHQDVIAYGMFERVSFFKMPESVLLRYMKAVFIVPYLFFRAPRLFIEAFNYRNYGPKVFALDLLYALRCFLENRERFKEYHILHCHFGSAGLTGLFFKNVGASGKLVTVFHGYDITSYVKKHGRGVYRALFKSGDLFMPVCHYFREKLIKLGCPPEKIKVHFMGVDIEKFPYRERKFKYGQTLNILTVGRLVEKKGHKYVIEALARFVKKYPHVKYWIVGDGPERKNLEETAKKCLPDGTVVFTGAITQQEVLKYYLNSHIFVLASCKTEGGDEEGIPVVIREAMATGMVVVATKHAGIPEAIVDGENGFLLPEADSEAISSRLEELVKNPHLWGRISKRARETVENECDLRKLNDELQRSFLHILKSEAF